MKRRLGELLLDRQQIDLGTLETAIEEQSGRAARLGEILLDRELVAKQPLITALTEITHVPYLDPSTITPDAKALERISREAAMQYWAIPVGFERKALVVVMAEPQDLHVINTLQFLCGQRISPRLGFRQEILKAIETNYPVEEAEVPPAHDEEPEAEFFTASTNERAQAAVREFQAELRHERTPAVRLVSQILAMAVKRNASDVHVEPLVSEVVVRFRVDGVLHEAIRTPAALKAQLISRLKILADMDIAEHRAPQDGRFLVKIGGRQIDLRVSSIATQHGEKIVLRLLDPTTAQRSFADLGFSREHMEPLLRVLRQPQGMVLVTGPTGSGKTTTLYAALNAIRSPKINIVTIEDPVEYMLEGVNQVQVSAKTGRGFAECLRSMLRQDPNVILVGEIRDAETAEIALRAAQTGHMVLSTMHTNDAVAAVSRLLDLGVPSFLIASSLSAVIAQRLVRKLCKCRRQEPLTDEEAGGTPAVALSRLSSIPLWKPVGCAECADSGYRGRVAVCELLMLDEEIRAGIREGVGDSQVRDLARTNGMRLMQEEALLKVERGDTSLEEVLRLVPFDFGEQKRCAVCRRLLAAHFLFCPHCGTSLAPQHAESARPGEPAGKPDRDHDEASGRRRRMIA